MGDYSCTINQTNSWKSESKTVIAIKGNNNNNNNNIKTAVLNLKQTDRITFLIFKRTLKQKVQFYTEFARGNLKSDTENLLFRNTIGIRTICTSEACTNKYKNVLTNIDFLRFSHPWQAFWEVFWQFRATIQPNAKIQNGDCQVHPLHLAEQSTYRSLHMEFTEIGGLPFNMWL